jgi:uncharacterized protein (TIGR02001 family)
VDTFIPLQLIKKGNTMLKNKLLVAALASAFALPVLAEDAPAPSPFSSNVALTTNYLYRGISQSGAGPAIQGGFDYAGASGLYIGAWGSSISWLSDAGAVATQTSTATGPAIANSGLELDTYFGYKAAAGAVSYDVGFLRYNYPGTYANGVTSANTNEVYGALTYSIVTAKLSYCLGDLFGISKAKGSTYLDLSAAYPIADTGVTLGAHYGKQTYKGETADGMKSLTPSMDPSYSDYNVSVAKDFSGYVASLMYSKTNATTGGWYTNLQGKDTGKGVVVLTLKRAM